ncbi:MAG: HAMP domain-containing histidine kinase [Eubacteriaceae bacterium]|nr:HAMP domain-containing histidine kinase [Eubacteriaceae bacterium]
MKKYLFVYIVAGIALLAGFALHTSLLKAVPRQEVDNTAVNEIAKQASLFWRNLEQLNDMNFKYRFCILDNKNDVCYLSDESLPTSMQAAIRQGLLPIDVIVNSTVVGKALIEVYPGYYIGQAQTKLANSALIVFLLLGVSIFTGLLVLHINIVRPFLRLEEFAHKISTGKFDEPLPMDKSNIFGPFTNSFDIMRSSLLESRQKQLAAESAQKEFIASLNHDIKTPVTSIKLTSELLQASSNIDSSVIKKLKIIDEKADQISHLVNDIMSSALDDIGELRVDPASMESSALHSIFTKADDLSKTMLDDIPSCLLELDLVRMEQVIGNIITNSYKYAGTDIHVSFKIVEGFLHIYINDFGDGVAPEELELICTKFYRGENAKAANKEGEGLGLYIAKQLMERMGGGLEASNRDDGFTIALMVRLSR